jgi:[protein-PII] uridylyltransferase
MTSFVAELRNEFKQRKGALLEEFVRSHKKNNAAHHLLRQLCKQVDNCLIQLWQHANLPKNVTLVAVGGYGRGELFPYSDVDVLILLQDDPVEADTSTHTSIEKFIALCWDTGLEIGSSVCTLQQCGEESLSDLTVQTALLESRFLCGSRPVFNAFRLTKEKNLHSQAFFRDKTLEMRQRHQKFEDTPYSLEPNCKESPGGLRDIQVVVWVARAAGLGKSWAEMVQAHLITKFEAKRLRQNANVLKRIRIMLHIVAGRREDRLLFDLQTQVAEHFGLLPRKGQRMSEALMRQYYWAAKAVTQLNQILMLNLEEHIQGVKDIPLRRISSKFYDRDGLLEIASDDLFLQEPNAILETFLTYQMTTGLCGLSARTLRALYNARHLMNARFRRDPFNKALFLQILKEPAGQTHVLRLMNQTSVLGRYLWVFRKIVGQMQHDLFHAYTVDQHILMVLRNVRRFFIPEHAHEYPFCSLLAANWERPYQLYIAALFHDVAKGRGGDHSGLGAIEARRFCNDHGLDTVDMELIVFLVQHHLTLSRVAQKEDLSDPNVIDKFVRVVGNERRLTALYLLTVADIRGTSPQVWNAWKGKLLEDLYRAALRTLGGIPPNSKADLVDRKKEARQLLNLRSVPPGVETHLWQALDISYFARHDAAEIAWHARSLQGCFKSQIPVVRGRLSPLGEGMQVLVYAKDQPDLFARICGYFDTARFHILDAKIHTALNGYALDTFQVLGPFEEQHHRDLISLVETQLTQILKDKGPLTEPSRGRLSRRVRSFPFTPRITLQPDERAQHWILSVSSNDRPGLLYAIAQVLAQHKINLHLAKISTLGERVEDTFLISGSSLLKNKTQLQLEKDLFKALHNSM